MIAVLYAAKSTEDEKGSIASQLKACREHCDSLGWAVDSEHSDEAKSGYKGSRGPGLAAARARCAALVAAGEEAALVCFATDRLARGDGRQAAHLLDYVLEATREGYRVESVTEDIGGEMGLVLAALYGQRNAHDSKVKGEHVKRAMRDGAAEGRFLKRAPFGYRLGPDQRLAPHPTEAEVVRRVFREYLDGRGINRIVRDLRADDVRTRKGALLSLSRVGDMLARREYVGDVMVGGEVVAEGAHPAIIDRDTFEAVQRLRDGRSSGSRGRESKRHLLQGLLICSNGHAMISRGREDAYVCGVRHAYGASACDCPQVSRAKVDGTILSHFLNRHWDADAERERLLGIGREKAAEAIALASAADREEAEAQASLARVKADYKRGAITAEQWAELEAELIEEAQASRANAEQLRGQAELVSAEADAADAEIKLVMKLATMLQAAAGKAVDEETVAAMRAALGQLFSRVTFAPGTVGMADAGTYVSGAADLIPVLREDVVPTRQGGGWVWGTRARHATPVRTEHLRNGHG